MEILRPIMPEGTGRSRRGFDVGATKGTFRRHHHLWLSLIGFGTLVEENTATITVAPDRPDDTHRAVRQQGRRPAEVW